MGLFNNFPYMDLSNLNLDFVLKKLKDLTNYAESAERDAHRAETASSIAVVAREAAESAARSAESSSRDAQAAESSAENYAAHIADPVGGLVTGWLDDNITPTTPPVDASLTIQGAAADAKATGDAIAELRTGTGLKPALKSALLACFRQVLGKAGFEDAYDVLDTVLNDVQLVSITADFRQGAAVIYDDTPLNDLKQYLTVTANYENGTSSEVTAGYTLSGLLDLDTSAITVTYEGKTATFNVDVTLPVYDYLPSRDGKLSELESIRTYVSNANDFSESVTESGNLRLQGTNSADTAYYQFVFKDLDETDGSHVHSGRIKAEVQIYTLPTASSSVGIFGCVLKLSNGSSGITFGQAKSGSTANLNYAEGNTRITARSGVAVGEIWREFELTYNDGNDGSTPFQKLTMDGETVFESNTLSTWSTTSSCIMVLSNPLYFVRSLKVYNK